MSGADPEPASERPDLRLVPAAIAGWSTAWLVPAIGAGPGVALGAGALSIGGAALAIGRGRRRVVAIGIAVVTFATAGVAIGAAARVAAIAGGPVADLVADSRSARVELVVTADAEPVQASGRRGEQPVRLRARLERVGDVRVRVPVVVLADRAGWGELAPSTRVRAFGRLTAPYRVDGTAAVISARGEPEVLGGPSALQRVAADLRSGLRTSVDDLPQAERGLVPGLTVGDTTLMPADLVEQFQRAGLTHLTAVSGANLAIVVAVVLFAGRWVGLRGRVSPMVAFVAMVGFVVLARPQPSVVRAAVMATFAVVALVTGRRRVGVPALCAAVLVVLLVDPWLARSYGFALSVLATAGLLLLAPVWRDRLADWLARRLGRDGPGRALQVLADAVSIPAAAQVACLPVLVMLSGEVSLVAVVANLLAIPAVAPVTVLGLLALVTAVVSEPVAGLVAQVAGWPAGWIVRVAQVCAGVPGAALPWRPGPVGALTVLALLAVAALLVPYIIRRPALAVAAACVLAAVLVRPVVSLGWPPAGWLLVACDVGQGDGLVLRAGGDAAVVVDAGPEPAAMDRCLRDLGVGGVPIVILTHFHADHVFGLPGVLDGRRVGEILVSPLPDPEENAALVDEWAATGGGVRPATPGEVLTVGSLVLQVLGPARLVNGDGSAANNASVVVLAETGGLRVLLTGDIEPEAQALLLSPAVDLRADVFKVPHHGSAYQDPRLLPAVRPDVSLISVGADNDYGHPAEATVDALTSAGVLVARTDQHGDLAIIADDGEPRVVARR